MNILRYFLPVALLVCHNSFGGDGNRIAARSIFLHIDAQPSLVFKGKTDTLAMGILPADVAERVVNQCDQPSKRMLRRVNRTLYDAFFYVVLHGDIRANLVTEEIGEDKISTFKDRNMRILAGMLHNNSMQFQSGLSCRITESDTKGWELFVKALKNQKHIGMMGIDQLRSGQFRLLLRALGKNQSIQDLSLGRNKIPFCEMKQMANLLQNNTSLKGLYLGNSTVGDFGAMAIAQGLKNNTTLECIDLYGAAVGTKGAVHLAEVLKKNTTLTALDLHNNKIGDAGATALQNALTSNTSLQRLWISGSSNGISCTVKASINVDQRIADRIYLY